MSKAIDDLKHEHDAILFALKILDSMSRQIACNRGDGGDIADFIGFLKEFADKCHHGKEEGMLFPALIEAGLPAQGGPIAVMLADHARGREWIQAMQAAASPVLDAEKFTAAATGYINLLRAHIDKENNILFPMADELLTPEKLKVLNDAFEQHENNVIGQGRHEELHALVKKLKEKYPVG